MNINPVEGPISDIYYNIIVLYKIQVISKTLPKFIHAKHRKFDGVIHNYYFAEGAGKHLRRDMVLSLKPNTQQYILP